MAAATLTPAVASAPVPSQESSDPLASNLDHADGDQIREFRPSEVTSAQIDAEATVRARLGFASDSATIEARFNDDFALREGRIYGFTASADEVREMQVRLLLQRNLVAIRDTLTSDQAATFAGAFVDHRTGGEAAVQFTEPPSESVIEEIAAGLSDPTRLDVRIVDHSLVALEADRAVIFELFANNHEAGVFAVGVYPMRNVVEVLTTDIKATTAALSARGVIERVTLEETDGVEEETSKVRGGARLRRPSWSNDCSAGIHGVRNGQNVLVTAGHCSNTLRHFSHSPTFIRVAGQNSGAADVQAMTYSGSSLVRRTIKNYAGGSHIKIDDTVTVSGNGDSVGDWVCNGGATTQWAPGFCDQIDSVNWACGSQHTMRQVDFTIAGGDSGAPVFTLVGPFGNSADVAGFVEGSCSGQPRYTFVDQARLALGISSWYT